MKIVDQRNTAQQESVHYQVSVPTVMVITKAHQNIVQIILKSCRNLGKTTCFNLKMKWSGRWNMLIAADKTEVLVFPWDGRPPDEDVVVEYGGEKLSHRF